MCGLWALFGFELDSLACICDNFSKISHRGPDAFKIEYDNRIKNAYLGFHRLSIIDSLCGMQPIRLYKYPLLYLLCNGEIYNCKNLKEKCGFEYSTKCDVEVLMHLYVTKGPDSVCKFLDGVFSFCLLDAEKKKILLGRDPYGVRPLFRILTTNGQLAISSECKALVGIAKLLTGDHVIEPFPPGTFEEYDIMENGLVKFVRQERYHEPGQKPSFDTFIPWNELDSHSYYENIKILFSAAVEKRLMADRRIGCFLSGGLDSSLVASLLVKLAKQKNLPYKIQSFSIGMEGSPDIVAARQVADYIGTEHHEVIITQKDISEVLDKVIYYLETFDITTIRASIGMYLVARYVKINTDTTVIFSGEGADELAQGYIYFRDAPNASDGHKESLRLLKDIYLYDGLRADRMTSAFGLELRVPFLDLQFTNYYLSLDPLLRQPQNGIEKRLLRAAFEGSGLLPDNILWRTKEAFSDGVTSVKNSLFQILNEIIKEKVHDEDLKTTYETYPHCTPKTKEAYYYRKVFESYYRGCGENLIPYYWMPRWVKGVTDPSARFISHYKNPV